MMSKYFWKMDKLQKKGTLIKGEMLEKQETTNYTKECFSPQEKAGVVSIRERAHKKTESPKIKPTRLKSKEIKPQAAKGKKFDRNHFQDYSSRNANTVINATEKHNFEEIILCIT